jgi:hypothetical protein
MECETEIGSFAGKLWVNEDALAVNGLDLTALRKRP